MTALKSLSHDFSLFTIAQCTGHILMHAILQFIVKVSTCTVLAVGQAGKLTKKEGWLDSVSNGCQPAILSEKAASTCESTVPVFDTQLAIQA